MPLSRKRARGNNCLLGARSRWRCGESGALTPCPSPASGRGEINPGGYATPDDVAVFEDCQRGYRAPGVSWLHGYERGMAVVQAGGNEISTEMGIRPIESLRGPVDMQNEVSLHAPLREWVRLLEAGLSGTQPYD